MFSYFLAMTEHFDNYRKMVYKLEYFQLLFFYNSNMTFDQLDFFIWTVKMTGQSRAR